MLRVIATCSMAFFSGCAASEPPTAFDTVIRGETVNTSDVEVSGIIDTAGVNFYSLFDVDDQRYGSECIGLILSGSDQKRANLLNGRKVSVRGRVFFQADLNRVLPNEHGEINGRSWSGTRCTGETVIYVHELQTGL